MLCAFSKACDSLLWYLDSLTGERWPGEMEKKVGRKLTGTPGSKDGD